MPPTVRVHLGRLPELAAEPRVVAHEGPPPWRSILVVPGSGGVRAFWNVCQHLPIPLDAGTGRVVSAGGELVCASHGARFRAGDGLCTAGPCQGWALEPITVERVGDDVYATIGADRAGLVSSA